MMADDRASENEPLLGSNNENYDDTPLPPVCEPTAPILPNEAPPEYAASPNGPPPPVMPGESPPPYSPPTMVGVTPMINCRVCQAMINLDGKLHQHVVKCSACNEATPIKEAPAGKKYVRCPCNCLLICKASSKRIACPRVNCKRIINLSPMSVPTSITHYTSANRVVCGHCNETFRFPHASALARCPHCRRVSSVGSQYAKNRCIIYTVLGLIFLGAGIGVTIGTYAVAENSGGIYFLWIGAFVIGILNLIRALYYGTMKISYIE
ncbi:type 1 phosphatidylinositol 4,5-bisphosphate 4-phosphatase-like [Anneissia japonica]|uniref:type 1 phosphatidylinositol 4,5-bisphosphate 4-phosphatase-like n=1 Tax=Anneissia japonica TaxID=1529436 RepID=UPI0014257D81|nr:type 1 phosphatidylinositol 4,5-bisphosphate 4-phosphatase-like [Anneissia japonica]